MKKKTLNLEFYAVTYNKSFKNNSSIRLMVNNDEWQDIKVNKIIFKHSEYQKSPFAGFKQEANIKLIFNNDYGKILANTNAGNLKLQSDNKGLIVKADLPLTRQAIELYEYINAGYVDSISIDFAIDMHALNLKGDLSDHTVINNELDIKAIREINGISINTYTKDKQNVSIKITNRNEINRLLELTKLKEEYKKLI